MFEKNIKALKEKNPALAERLEKIELDSIKDNIIVAEAETKDLIIGYKDTALHSTIDPVREANAIWNQTIKTDLKKNDVQIIFGLGLGYLFKRAYVNANSKVFVIEPFADVLRFVLEYVDLSAELADERVYLTDKVEDILEKLRAEYLQGDRAEFLFLLSYASLAKGELQELTEKSLKILEEKSCDVNTIFRLSLRWTRNFILNIPHFLNFRPLSFLKDSFVDKTALIITAGPSLAENIDKIKQNRSKFVTIATGKALKMLAANGITPDFVIFADATSLTHQTEGVENILEKTNIIMTLKTDTHVAELKSKAKILYLTGNDLFSEAFDRYLGDKLEHYKSAGSVSLLGYFAARALGFNNIAFVGLDLGFPGNKIYATGENLETNANGEIKLDGVKFSRKKLTYVKDKNGNDIPTRDDYLIFIRQLEEILEQEISLSRVINTSLNGAYVKGMDYTGFDEFIANLKDQSINIDELISAVYNNTEDKWSNCVKNVFNEFYGKYDEIKEVMSTSELLLSDIQSTLEVLENNEPDNNEISELNNRTEQIRKKILNNPILQYALQGKLWAYTRDYIMENLSSRETIVNNLNQDCSLISDVVLYSVRILKFLENSSNKMKTSQKL